MKLLLDTCTGLWWWEDSPHLSRPVREKIADSRNTVYFSAASALEISTKVRLGKLGLTGTLARDLEKAVATSGWKALPIEIREAQQAGALDWSHRDPFDRLLAAQALLNGLCLLTCDSVFESLEGIRIYW